MASKTQRPTAAQVTKLQEQLSVADNALLAQKQITAAQQSEIEQMREMVRELTAPKPGRAFRTRRLPLDRLDVTIKGADITEDEVVIEQGRGFIMIRVGDAIGQMSDATAPREAYRYMPHEVPPQFGQPAMPPSAAARPANDTHTTTRDVWEASVQANEASGLAGGDPSVVNASLAPQGDPRMPGGWQINDDVAQTAAANQFGGWAGIGKRPHGWVDPHAKPPETAH